MFLSPVGMTFQSGDFELDRAFRLAIGDVFGNVRMYRSGVMDKPAPCLCAGLSYPDPWTRDAAFNTWSGAGLLMPEVMKNTLLSCLTRGDASAGMGEGCFDEKGSQVPPDRLSIAGQYWDRIIWAVGAWAWYRQNGDRAFLALALAAIRNSLPYLEDNEYDPERRLFRGGACIADGMGAYGDRYQHPLGSGIYHWPEANPRDRHPKGAGLPMMCLSTNCLYAEGYRIAQVMADELGEQRDPHWQTMRRSVIEGIRTRLWDEEGGFFRVYDDPWGGSGPHRECLGNCFALLFEGIATPAQRARIVERQPHLAFGPPAVWPDFPRYLEADVPIESCPAGRADIAAENHILSQYPDIRRGIAGHGGAVWPLMMGIYGEAVLREGHADLFARELHLMADIFCRAVQCPEIVHPDCGAPGGAVGEAAGDPPVIQRAVSCYRQTWSATSYLRLILHGLLGIDCRPEGLAFQPTLPEALNEVELLALPYRRASLNIRVERRESGGRGERSGLLLDGEPLADGLLPGEIEGERDVRLHV